jgi:uncharacterized protein (TIGR03382 family)
MTIAQRIFVGILVCTAGSSAALAGPDWVERGDAGAVLGTAQITRGVGQITNIEGTLSGASLSGNDFEDMYIIEITQPSTFFFSSGNATFDSALYLFNITEADEAFGLLGTQNDGELRRARLIGFSNDGSGAQLVNPGLYALAVTFAGNRPQSRTGDIFTFDGESEISGPDGPGGTNPHSGWAFDGQFSGGSYNIEIEGVGFAEVPAPSTLAFAGLAGLVASRRRRA